MGEAKPVGAGTVTEWVMSWLLNFLIQLHAGGLRKAGEGGPSV